MRDCPPDARNNTDVLFLYNMTSPSERTKVYKDFFGMLKTQNDFNSVLDACTEGYSCLVLDTRIAMRDPANSLFFYKADLHPENFKLGKEVEHWRVAVKSRVLSKWIEGLTFDSKPTQENLKARVALGELSSKLLKEGWFLSENAARLDFPSCQLNSNAMPFDFIQLKDVMFNYGALEIKMLERYKDQPDLLIRDQYLLNIKRHFRKKRRIEKVVDKAVDEAVTKALKKEKEEQEEQSKQPWRIWFCPKWNVGGPTKNLIRIREIKNIKKDHERY
jgi:hypothetical protein